VQWSLGFVAFLTYVFCISTYALNIGSIAMITALVAITLGQKDRWNIPLYVIGPLMGFLLVVAIGYQSTRWTAYRFYGWDPVKDLAKVFMIFAVATSVLTTRERIRFFIFFYLGCFGLYPVRGALFNFFIYHASTQGRVAWNYMFENPNDFSSLMLFPMGLAMGVYLAEPNKWVKRAAMVGLGLIPLTIFMSQSRGGILALVVGAFVVFMGYRRGRMRLLVGSIVIAVGLAIFAPSSVWQRLGNTQTAVSSGNLDSAGDSHSAEQRYNIWRLAFRVAEDFPVLGVGWGAYPFANAWYARAAGQSAEEAIARGAHDAHNTFLTVLAETGIVGSMLWWSAVAAVVATSMAGLRRLRQAASPFAEQLKFILVALLAFGVASVFGSFAHLSFTYIHLALLLALTRMAKADEMSARLRMARR
jgi:O-antigen ligase